MGVDLSNRQMRELYVVLDRDGDGEIDTKELLRGLTDTQRASEVAWIRFAESEKIVLQDMSEHMGSGNRDDPMLTSRTGDTMETTPNNIGHSELYRLLLHARAEFELCYPDLSPKRSLSAYSIGYQYTEDEEFWDDDGYEYSDDEESYGEYTEDDEGKF